MLKVCTDHRRGCFGAIVSCVDIMKKLKTTQFHAGDTIDQALFLPNGQKLLNAGSEITERHLRVLAGLPDPDLYLADSLEELVEAGMVQPAERRSVQRGRKADRDMLTPTGSLVVEQGEEIEQHHVDALKRGVFKSSEDKQDRSPAQQRRDRMVMAEAIVEQLIHDTQDLPLRVQPQSQDIWNGSPPDVGDWPDIESLRAQREHAVQQVRGWYTQIESGQSMSASEIQSVIDTLYDQLLQHPRYFTQLALMCPGRSRYLPDHAFSVSVIAMAMAAQLKWSSYDIKQVSLAAMLMDAGMQLVPERIRLGGCALSEIDRNRVHRHPAYSIALIQHVDQVEPLTQLAVYQHHERETGVGYPTGLRTESICDYAKVLGVADVFCAAISHRSYHTPKLPYVVMEEIIRSAAAGIFCKHSGRALVQAAGLFPVGSYVLLSNRRTARVLATHVQRLDRPIVRVLDPDKEQRDPVVDLLKMPVEELSIVRAVQAPQARQSVA